MTNYSTRKTPDYSPLVVHFTKEPDRKMGRDDLIGEKHPLFSFKTANAKNRLLNILKAKKIYASPIPFLPSNSEAVCFTECIWDALVSHSDRYSPFGVVFSKKLIFDKGGGPALYVRGDSLKTLDKNIPSCLEPLIAPFDPKAVLNPGILLDWVHEREWRLPGTLDFEYGDIEHVIVATLQDSIDILQQIGAQHIPIEKFIPMDVYRSIKKTWKD